MLETGSCLYGDLSAVVAARSLAALVCSLLPSEGGSSQVILKAQLRTLRDRDFVWPSEEAVLPENLPTLPKNIAKKIH